MARIVAKLRTNIYKEEWYQKVCQGCKTKWSFPTHGLQSWHIVFRDELLLVHYLGGHNDLGAEDQEVSHKDVCCIILAPRVSCSQGDGGRHDAELGLYVG